MEYSLLWGAGALGVVAWLLGLLSTRSARDRAGDEAAIARPFLLAAVLLPVLVFLATLPGRPPFSEGHGWGRGFLLGGVGAGLAALVVRRGARAFRPILVPVAVYAIALAVLVAPLLLLRTTLMDALLGTMIGWLVVSFLLFAGWEEDASNRSLLVAGTGFAVTLGATFALGTLRGPLTPELARGAWSAVAAVFAAGMLPALLIASAPTERPLAFWQRWLAPAVLAGLSWLLSSKVVADPKVFTVAVLGLGLGPALGWVLRNPSDEPNTDNAAAGDFSAALALALVASGFLVAYQMLQGFGVGLLLLAAWLTPAATRGLPRTGIGADRLTQLLLAGVVLLLYRLFASRWDNDLRTVTLTDHYALFGFLLGAVLPRLLAGLLEAPRPGLVRVVVAGAAVLAVPGVVVVLWNVKCALALLAGLALSGVVGATPERRTRLHALFPALLAVAVALALAQWTGHVLPLSDLTRVEKIRLLLVLSGGLFALILGSGFSRQSARTPAGEQR